MSTGGFIYAIGAVGTPLVKIGSAKNVELRRKQLQTGQPFPLQIRASVAVAHDIGRIEKRIQAMLREVPLAHLQPSPQNQNPLP